MDVNYLCKGCCPKELCLLKLYAPVTKKCPCTICLVKVTCKTKCDERKQAYANLSRDDKITLHKTLDHLVSQRGKEDVEYRIEFK